MVQKLSGRMQKKTLTTVHFPFQVSIVLDSTHHMTPGHGLLIRPAPSSSSSTITDTHTHKITYSDATMDLLFFQQVYRKADMKAEIMMLTCSYMCPALSPETSSMQPIEAVLVSFS